jgi:nicotinamide-nucleotide amidase
MFFSHARFVVWIEKKRNEMAEDNLVELARQLGILLQKHDLVLATAESLTGGFISQAVTSVPGSSAWFDRGFVVYNDEAKKSMLHVSEKTLKEHTAVSSVVARQMAHGALSNSKATIAVAVTGVAGPTGPPQIPVGTVFFSMVCKKNIFYSKVQNEKWVFKSEKEDVRNDIRRQTTESVLKYLIGILSKASLV